MFGLVSHLYQIKIIVLVNLFLVDLHFKLPFSHLCIKVNTFTWMTVGPLGKTSHQPILRGEDEAPVVVIVGVLEDTQELRAQRERGREEKESEREREKVRERTPR